MIQRFKSLESKLATVKYGLYNNSNNGKQSCYRNKNCKIKQYNKLKNLFKLLRSLVCERHIKDMFIDHSPQTEAQPILQHNFTPPQYVKSRLLKFQCSFNFKIFTESTAAFIVELLYILHITQNRLKLCYWVILWSFCTCRTSALHIFLISWVQRLLSFSVSRVLVF